MEQFQNQYAAVSYEYGNPFRSDQYGMRVDEYGNPVRQTIDEYGQHYGSTGTFSDAPVYQQHSSKEGEDVDRYGYGGKRKKGLKEKIKEKIPGMGHKHGHHQSTEGRHEKGMMEKIKEKLPGHHHNPHI